MIKKWNIFLESYTDKELSEIKDKVGEFMGEKEINDLIKSSILKDIMDFFPFYASSHPKNEEDTPSPKDSLEDIAFLREQVEEREQFLEEVAFRMNKIAEQLEKKKG